MTEFAEQLRALRQPPEPSMASEAFVASVMAACIDEAPSVPQAMPRQLRRLLVATTLLAAAAAVLLVLHGRGIPGSLVEKGPSEAEYIAARGAGSAKLSATVQAFVGRPVLGNAPALLEGAELGPGDGILVRYSNPADQRAFLMVFALDAQREVHWLHPAYLDFQSDPASLELRRGVAGVTLDEVAEPENPAPGALVVYALLSETPLTVKAVEAKLARGPARVHELFPEAEVEEWRCTWRAR